MKTYLLTLIVLVPISSFAQDAYDYHYDEAGNRTNRVLSTKSAEDDNSTIEEAQPLVDRNEVETTVELQFSEEISLKLFPNPVNEFFIVQVTGDSFNELITLEIVNTSGQIVKTEQVSGMNNQVDTSNLASGFYVLKATFRNETLNWSFIKQL